MMTGWLVRFVVVVVAAIAITTTCSISVSADCCMCSNCPAGGSSCLDGTSCSELCAGFCASAGCAGSTFDGRTCNAIPACAAVTAPAGGGAMYLSLTLLLATVGLFALRRRSLPTGMRAAAAALVLLSTAVGLRALTQIRLSGQWQLDSTASEGSGLPTVQEQWSADLALSENGSISGTVTGFSNINVVGVEGTVHDGAVVGTLRDGDGPTVAKFEGTIADHSLRGTFTKLDSGETGTFSWRVPAS